MFQILDFVLLGIMAVSGLLALARGLVRELLSLAAWGVAGAAAYFAIKNKQIMDAAAPHFDPTKPIIAQVAVGAGAFVIVFIVFSVIGMKISDRVVDSRAGAFDRTLGLVYGLARGLVLVSICYIFYGWLIPADKQEDWVRNAASLPAINRVAEFIKSYLPEQIRDELSNAEVKGNGPDLQDKAATSKDQDPKYSTSQQQGLGNLAKGAAGQDSKKQ